MERLLCTCCSLVSYSLFFPFKGDGILIALVWDGVWERALISTHILMIQDGEGEGLKKKIALLAECNKIIFPNGASFNCDFNSRR